MLGFSRTIGDATEAVGARGSPARWTCSFPRLLRFMDRISRRGVQGNNERFVQNLKKVLENDLARGQLGQDGIDPRSQDAPRVLDADAIVQVPQDARLTGLGDQ